MSEITREEFGKSQEKQDNKIQAIEVKIGNMEDKVDKILEKVDGIQSTVADLKLNIEKSQNKFMNDNNERFIQISTKNLI